MLTESQRERLISRWNLYLAVQRTDTDNRYGSASGQLGAVQRYIAPPATILFIGCGDGLEVAEARKAGYDAYGATLGQQDVDRAKSEYGVDILLCDAHLLPDDWENRFDGVFSFQTVEHSISGFLMFWEIHRILKPGGRFYAEVPHQSFTENHSWHHITSPTPPQMKGWLLKLRFTTAEAGYIDDHPAAARWAYALATK